MWIYNCVLESLYRKRERERRVFRKVKNIIGRNVIPWNSYFLENPMPDCFKMGSGESLKLSGLPNVEEYNTQKSMYIWRYNPFSWELWISALLMANQAIGSDCFSPLPITSHNNVLSVPVNLFQYGTDTTCLSLWDF